MTARDPDRLIHDFVLEGAERLDDQVYDAIRADIERRPQRVVIGPWRMPIMNKLVPIALGAAAVVAVVFGLQQRTPAPGGVGGNSSPAPSPTSVTTASPSGPATSPSPSAPAGLPVGSSYVLTDPDATGSTVGMKVTIPATGWNGDGGILIKGHADPPDGNGIIVYADADAWRVPSDPCHWRSTTPDKAATTADKLASQLAAQQSRDASSPVAKTLDGHSGKSITLHVPDDAAFAGCDEGEFCSFLDAAGADCQRYHQGPGQIDVLWIGKVNKVLVVIDASHYAGTPTEVITELEALVDSVTFQ